MRFITKWGLLLIPAFALAMPALAAPRDIRLSDSQQPGSVIIFPKFINNTPVRTDTPTGALLPRTEIELGVVCPPGVPVTTTTCFEHQTVKVHGHWVCPGSQDITNKYICPETDFVLFLSVNGKLAFSADGRPYWSNAPRVPKPPCQNGYLIVWVVDNADHPIKFDGLIGDAVLRGPHVAPGISTEVSAYSGITIQASTGLAHGAVIPNATTGLHFTGTLAGGYLGVTNVLYGDVKFDNVATDPAHTVPTPVNAFSRTFLTLITLDVHSNQPNNVTLAPIYFYNESLNIVSTTNPLWEFPISASVHFLCYGQFPLSSGTGFIDANLTQEFMGARKGVFVAGPATQVEGPFGEDEGGEVTLLGLVHTIEGIEPDAYMNRSYIYTPYNDSHFVPTTFEWLSTVHPVP